jgi:hypothetical protein
VKESSDWIPFALLDDLPLDLRQRATIEGLVSEMFRTDHHWSNSRRQLIDCLAYGVVEVFQQLPVQPPTEGGANVSAGQPKFNTVLLVCHRLLCTLYQPPTNQLTAQKETHFYHREDNTEGTKHGLGWGDATEFLRKIRGFDCYIERGENEFSTFLLSSVGVHLFEVEVAGGNVAASRL